ncbi:hypothetical protein RR48_05714 [Papilio machaon]|uniref:Uncharacterized protein n=1 Tax=Papilio machaon TaxID=76193 RepID=A0A0N1IFP1_PAPMA|nr:hypothetical protein RR48_05714 [Papilio machaon]
MTEKNKSEKMTNASKPVPMKLFAAWEVDRTPSNCIPRRQQRSNGRSSATVQRTVTLCNGESDIRRDTLLNLTYLVMSLYHIRMGGYFEI